MHLGPVNGPFVPHVKSEESPVALLKFHIAPKLMLLMSSGSKKKEPRYACLSEAKASQSQRMWTMGIMTGNVIISEVDALVYNLLSKAEKHMPYGKLVCTRESMMLQMRCHTNRGRYNQVQLHTGKGGNESLWERFIG